VTLTIEAIEQYLNEHPEAMESLRLKTDQQGETISFAERRAQMLADKLSQTESKLAELIEVSRENERLFHACKQCLLDLIAAPDTRAIGEIIEQSLSHQFDVEAHQLFLYSEPTAEPLPGIAHTSIDAQKAALAGLYPDDRPRLGAIRPEEAKAIFPESQTSIASAAIVPLQQNGAHIGLFCLGSTRGDHFHSQLGTHFLELLADIVCWKAQDTH